MYKFLITILLSIFWTLTISCQNYTLVDIDLRDMLYIPSLDKIAGLTSGYVTNGNQLVILHPETGNVEQSIPCGSNPHHLRLSDNEQYLYISDFGNHSILRYDLLNNVFDDPIWLSAIGIGSGGDTITTGYNTWDIVPIPNHSKDIIASVRNTGVRPGGVSIVRYNNGQKQPNQVIINGLKNSQSMVITDDGSTVWGFGHEYIYKGISKYAVTSQGITFVQTYDNFLQGQEYKIKYENGLIYAENGDVLDVSSGTPSLVDNFNTGFSSIPLALGYNEDYLYTFGNGGPNGSISGWNWEIRIIHKTTLQEFPTVNIPVYFSSKIPDEYSQSTLISLGNNRLAFLIDNSRDPEGRKLILLNTAPCPAADFNLSIQKTGLSCKGDTIVLSADPGYTDYEWSNSETTQNIYITDAFEENFCYRVKDSSGCWSKISEIVRLSFMEYPPPPRFWFDRPDGQYVCENIFSHVGVESQNSVAVLSTGDTLGFTFETTIPGIYKATSVNENGCISDTSTVELLSGVSPPLPFPNIQIIGDTILCEGESVELRAEPGFEYLWSNGDTSQFFFPTESGNYSVKYVAENGCESKSSIPITIRVNPIPQTTGLSSNSLGVGATNNAYDTFQWLRNGVPIPNQTSRSISNPDEGIYQARCYKNGCYSKPSELVAVTDSCYVSIESNPLAGTMDFLLKAVPNPYSYPGQAYFWDNGSLNNTIQVSSTGSYCVSLSFNTCTTSNCIDIQNADKIPVQVRKANGVLKDGRVILYDFNMMMAVNLDTLDTDGTGRVLFENVQQGDYLLRAEGLPSTPAAVQFLPTYHESTAFWADAQTVTVEGLQTGPFQGNTYYIDMLPTFAQAGNSSISGAVQFQHNLLQFQNSPESLGPPLPGVVILLLDASGNPISYSISDGAGMFHFADLPFGTYQIQIQVPGIPPVTLTIVLNGNNPNQSGILFYVDEDSGAVSNNTPNTQTALFIRPNPTMGTCSILCPEKGLITICSTNGRPVYSQTVNRGLNELEIYELPEGLYLVQLQSISGIFLQKLIKM